MLATEFVRPYASEMTPEQIHSGTHSQYMPEAQNWSYSFGQLLHTSLTQELSPVDLTALPDLVSYRVWLGSNPRSSFDDNQDVPPEDRLRCTSEFNFHDLNRALIYGWMAVVHGGWQSDIERRMSFAAMRKELVMKGLVDYGLRQDFAKKYGSEMLYTDFNKAYVDVRNGILQEYDAGVVLLDVAQKHPNMTVVPAPLQFERGISPRYNVDFVVADFDKKRAVGVQVKSNVRSDTVERYDPERVVLVDGNTDFNNVLSMRTKQKSSQQRVVNWPGLLTMRRVQDLPVPGKGMSNMERTHNHRLRAMAKQILGNINVNYPKAVSIIEERIMDAL